MTVTKRRVLGALVVLLIGALAFASADRCGEWPSAPPTLQGLGRGSGALAVGAAQVPVTLPGPVTVGGYGPLRPTSSAGDPVFARATLVDVGGQRVAVVSLDVLLLTQPLVAAIREGAGLPVFVTATHTHSSLGQFDRRLAAQLGALGRFDERVEQALVAAARAALTEATKAPVPVTMEVRSFDTAAFVRARSGDAVDTRGLEIAFVKPDGAKHARWLLLAAHPTLAPRRSETFDTDWPGLVAQGEGVTLVLQTSVGNASVNRAVAPDEQAVASQLAQALSTGARVDGCEQPGLSFASARVALPRPDGSRLAPWPFRALAENALCAAEEMDVEVAMVRLGPLSLLALPIEPSFEAAQVLERMSGATRVLALSDGYVGYLETPDVVRAGTGEAKRQWFGPELFERLSKASLLLAMATDRRGPRVPGK